MDITVTLNLLGVGSAKIDKGRIVLALPEGATLREVIEMVEAERPGFREAALDSEGRLSNQLTFFIDGENMGHRGGLAAVIEGGSTVNVIAAIAGG